MASGKGILTSTFLHIFGISFSLSSSFLDFLNRLGNGGGVIYEGMVGLVREDVIGLQCGGSSLLGESIVGDGDASGTSCGDGTSGGSMVGGSYVVPLPKVIGLAISLGFISS